VLPDTNALFPTCMLTETYVLRRQT